MQWSVCVDKSGAAAICMNSQSLLLYCAFKQKRDQTRNFHMRKISVQFFTTWEQIQFQCLTEMQILCKYPPACYILVKIEIMSNIYIISLILHVQLQWLYVGLCHTCCTSHYTTVGSPATCCDITDWGVVLKPISPHNYKLTYNMFTSIHKHICNKTVCVYLRF